MPASSGQPSPAVSAAPAAADATATVVGVSIAIAPSDEIFEEKKVEMPNDHAAPPLVTSSALVNNDNGASLSAGSSAII